MNRVKYGIIGSSGKMGKEISSLIEENGDDVVFKYDVDGEWIETEPQVLIDFSLPAAFEKTIEYIERFKIPLVIGTTGLSDAQIKKLKEMGKTSAVVQSFNFSTGIQMLLKCSEILNKYLDGWDVEISETHHRYKKDKPSGTALMIKDILDKDVNISSLRLGNVAGEHTVSFGGAGEVISIKHSATSRRTFAEGVIKSCNFVLDKTTGFYSFKDVLFSEA